ncbi:MAG: type II toxin-antitoxin system VapC family toxin [Ktedonobacterales bacterium]
MDTSGWTEPLIGNSSDHEGMARFYRSLIAQKRSLVTTNYVLTELVALLTTRSRFTRPELVAIVNGIRRISHFTLVHIDPATDAIAWAMLEKYTDKEWSLADAASFVVMRRMGITEAFTTDHHFAQAGFVRVPA